MSLSLLRSVLWDGGGDKGEGIKVLGDWKAVEEFFSRQSLDGLLPDAIAMLPAAQQPSIAVKMPLIARQLQVERMNHAMNEELLAFTAELNRRDIPYILFKGQGVASLYPKPQLRMCGDIDLYVPQGYVGKVYQGLVAFGAVREHENVHHICFRARGIVWELHHGICYFQKESRYSLFMRYVDEAMQESPYYAAIGDGKVRVLPPTLNVVLLLAHIVDHFYCEGVGLRQLCDYAIMLYHKRGEIDRHKLLQVLDDLSLTRSYRVFGYICIHYLGMSADALMLEPSEKDARLACRVMDNCLEGGNFGHARSISRKTLWHSLNFYARFFNHLWRYRQLCPSEALWWPLAKIKRALKGEVNISEERSAVHGLN